VSLNDLLRMMNRILGKNCDAIYNAPRAGDVRDSQADIGKARALLGYQPRVSCHAGLEQTLEWYRQTAPALALPATA
jgi:nucleoside-diphosphate-sugar epimerase